MKKEKKISRRKKIIVSYRGKVGMKILVFTYACLPEAVRLRILAGCAVFPGSRGERLSGSGASLPLAGTRILTVLPPEAFFFFFNICFNIYHKQTKGWKRDNGKSDIKNERSGKDGAIATTIIIKGGGHKTSSRL